MRDLKMSGSLGLSGLIEELEKIIDDTMVDDSLASLCKPVYSLKFDKQESNKVWLYNENIKGYKPYPEGIQVEPIDEFKPNDISTFCLIGNDLVKVPSKYIFEVGWN